MQIYLSSKKKAGLLVIITIAACILVAAIRIDGLSEKWRFIPEVVFALALMIILGVFSYLQIQKRITLLIDEALDSLASGIIYFDRKGVLARFNPAAAIMLPNISNDLHSDDYIGTYKYFLAYVYNHSLDIQDQSKLALDINQMNLSKLLFREVVEFNQRIVLVQFYQRASQDIVAVLTDISMMKRHIDEVAALTEENRIMIKALEAAGSSMLIAEVTEGESVVIFANERFAKTIRQDVEEISSQSFPEVFQVAFEDQMHIIREGVVKARTEGGAGDIVLKIRPDLKTVLWYALHILFFRDTNDKEFFVCFLSDQTQARIAQAKVFQSQKLEAVAQLAGGIAHDFNNILSVIDGFSKLIRKGLERGNDVTQFFESIDRGVERATQITGRLLTFGQRRVTQKIRLDVCEHVRAMEAILTPMMDGAINMIVSVQEDPCYIDASPDAITQIVMSLANNAREAMPGGGDLIISVAEASKSQILSAQKAVARHQNYACIQMIDTGVGMDAETLSRICEPFFTTKDPAKNSGLGMPLVYGLVKEMDSFIDIKSNVEVGTSVTILIPAREAPAHALFSKEVEKVSPDILMGKTILVVEDAPDVLEMEYHLLTEARLDVLKAANAEEALKIAQEYKGKIDFLLTDITMPEMDGVDLGRQFEKLRPDTKIILISAYPVLGSFEDSGKRERLPQSQILLAKPLVYKQLEEVMIASLNGTMDNNLLHHRHWVEREDL